MIRNKMKLYACYSVGLLFCLGLTNRVFAQQASFKPFVVDTGACTSDNPGISYKVQFVWQALGSDYSVLQTIQSTKTLGPQQSKVNPFDQDLPKLDNAKYYNIIISIDQYNLQRCILNYDEDMNTVIIDKNPNCNIVKILDAPADHKLAIGCPNKAK